MTGKEEPTVTISCVYFKASGKYYADGTERYPRAVFEGCIYPCDYGMRLRAIKHLPGLSSGYWPHYFTVEVTGKYTELVTPDPELQDAK